MDMDGSPGLMDVLPDAVIQHILCFLKSAKDVAVCSCVCRRWKELMINIPSLVFTRNLGDKAYPADVVVSRMVLNTVALEELVVYCPFSTVSLQACISHSRNSLKVLEFRVDNKGDLGAKGSMAKLECISDAAAALQTLRLWGGVFPHCPQGWRSFTSLRSLQIVGARLRDVTVRGIMSACPFLKELALLGCDGVKSLSIELEHLEICRLDLCGGSTECSISVSSSKLQSLEVQGVSHLRVLEDSSLRHLMVAKQSGVVSNVEVGKFPVLESLSLRGLQWSWDAVQRVLRAATEVQTLYMKVEFCGDENYDPFPEVDFAEFLLSHPKLKCFDVHGAMFAALSQKTQMPCGVLSPSLEEVNITIRSPLNPGKKLQILESLVNVSPALKKLVLKVTQMKSTEVEANDFFSNLLRLQTKHKLIIIQ